MAHTYTPVSDVTPDETIAEKLTWAYIVPNYDTWLELVSKENWADWYFGTIWTDDWTSVTIPTTVHISDISLWSSWLTINLLTWNNMNSTGKIKWSDWKGVATYRIYKDVTTPSKTYSEVTV